MEIRQFFFEIIGILIPGAMAVLALLFFALSPSDFGFQFPDPKAIETLLQPFGSQVINGLFLVGILFVAGHLVQQLSVYLLQLHASTFRTRRRNLISEVFGQPEVQHFILPPESSFVAKSAVLTPNDYFMMIYPDLAPRTKRETFVSISGFCGSMAVVTILSVTLHCSSLVLRIRLNSGVPWCWSIFEIPIGLILTKIWIDRCRYFYEMADRVVVNYFLSSFGTHFRQGVSKDNKPEVEE